jgi:flavin reductase (DIM6/NTAB) family NADH-FMN oxidoreductase RutF
MVAAPYFGVSILQACQAGLATRFAQRGVDRFRSVSPKTNGAAGVPLLEEAQANSRYRHHAHHPAGDHTILVGEVVHATVETGERVLHCRLSKGPVWRLQRAGAVQSCCP